MSQYAAAVSVRSDPGAGQWRAAPTRIGSVGRAAACHRSAWLGPGPGGHVTGTPPGNHRAARRVVTPAVTRFMIHNDAMSDGRDSPGPAGTRYRRTAAAGGPGDPELGSWQTAHAASGVTPPESASRPSPEPRTVRDSVKSRTIRRREPWRHGGRPRARVTGRRVTADSGRRAPARPGPGRRSRPSP
eukprot:553532-Hanusia_phi.AAC.1